MASLFESCPKKSYLQEFAESSNYLVMVCRDQANNLQKYWLQKAKKTGKVIRLTTQDRANSQPSLWKSGDYQVTLYADGIGRGNAYLESYNGCDLNVIQLLGSNRKPIAIDFIPELLPSSVGIGQSSKTQNNRSALVFPFHARAAQSSFDNYFTGCLGDPRTNG